MATRTDIANMALSSLGFGKEIVDIDTDTTAEAKAVRTFYNTARDTVLEWVPWPFAKSQVSLGLVTNDPSEEWAYSYTYPSDALRFLRVVSPTVATDISNDLQIPFRIFYGASSAEIWTNESDAKGEYVRSVDEPTRYPANFVTAFSFYLASLIAPRITGGDNFNLANRTLQLFQQSRNIAAAISLNEEQRGEEPKNEFVRSRL
jgi:hypothetical protein